MIKVNNSFEGKCIEEKLRLQDTEKQAIEAISPLVYTERKDGVLPEYDPRTDRWEIAREAATVVAESHLAKRKSYQEIREGKTDTKGNADTKNNAGTAVNSNGQQVTASPQN